MKKTTLLWCFVLVSSFGFGQEISGDWYGMLNVPGVQLRLVFHLSQVDGQWKATMDSPDQKAFNLPVKTVRFDAGVVTLEMPNLLAQYSGRLMPGGDSIAGTFSQGNASFPLGLTHKSMEAAASPKRPQEPKHPFPYEVEEVLYQNSTSGNMLAGTLTLPKQRTKVPVAILISGSGAQDRDETLLGHKPFLVLADYLTRQGIAVLRFDDRGVGKSTGDFASATSADFATDVEAGMAYLKTRSDIDVDKIGLIGHSEGGLIGSIVASQNKTLAFLILLAGPGVPGDEIILLQQQLIDQVSGTNTALIEKGLAFNKRAFELLKKEKDNDKVSTILGPELRVLLQGDPGFAGLSAEQQNEQLQKQLQTLTSPWFRFFLEFDPKKALQRVKCPVLALNGSLDLQVSPTQNLQPIEQALQKAHNKDVTIRELPGLNHLFQRAKTGSPAEYATIEETIDPAVLQLITDWLMPRMLKK